MQLFIFFQTPRFDKLLPAVASHVFLMGQVKAFRLDSQMTAHVIKDGDDDFLSGLYGCGCQKAVLYPQVISGANFIKRQIFYT